MSWVSSCKRFLPGIFGAAHRGDVGEANHPAQWRARFVGPGHMENFAETAVGARAFADPQPGGRGETGRREGRRLGGGEEALDVGAFRSKTLEQLLSLGVRQDDLAVERDKDGRVGQAAHGGADQPTQAADAIDRFAHQVDLVGDMVLSQGRNARRRLGQVGIGRQARQFLDHIAADPAQSPPGPQRLGDDEDDESRRRR